MEDCTRGVNEQPAALHTTEDIRVLSSPQFKPKPLNLTIISHLTASFQSTHQLSAPLLLSLSSFFATMAVLLTGGTGKTAKNIVPLLEKAKLPYVATSRSPKESAASPTAKFDWLDNSTWDNAFTHSSLGNNKISAIYLVAPPGHEDPGVVMNGFVDYARNKHGVKRFVLLAGSPTDINDPNLGKTWKYLKGLQEEGKDIEWAVLRPTWFQG